MQILEQKPLSGLAAKNLVMFIHGYGSNGEDLMSLIPFIQESLPESHFYSPNGIEPCDMGTFGYQWFSLRDRSPPVMERNIAASIPKVLKLIDDKLSELNLTYQDLILVGFSQGSMLSMYLAHHLNTPFKAVVAFSGMFYPPTKINNNTTPICLIHGTEDEVVPFASMKHSANLLRQIGATIETHAIDNLAHSIDLTGLKYAKAFLGTLNNK
ncbi:MAG: dienelactone hydrolase family protein [Rickettsiaceae bacterium]|nr:dienelactone hydrolase family protein [Rickettsiaceae bacterium]